MGNRTGNSEIFREKSVSRISSPDNLNGYIKSTTPTLWLMLGSIIVLLIGILVWAKIGTIDSASVVGCRVENNVMTAYISEINREKVCDETYLEINGAQYPIGSVRGALLANADSDPFLLMESGLSVGDWYYAVTCSVDLEDGEYKGKAVYEKISPLAFIMG